MVNPDNILDETLEQMIAIDEVGTQTFKRTERLVHTTLFSIFSERRRYTLSILKEDWGTPQLEIASTEDNGIIDTYISFEGKYGPYFFVGRYNAEEPVEEQPPSTEEMKIWETI